MISSRVDPTQFSRTVTSQRRGWLDATYVVAPDRGGGGPSERATKCVQLRSINISRILALVARPPCAALSPIEREHFLGFLDTRPRDLSNRRNEEWGEVCSMQRRGSFSRGENNAGTMPTGE